MNSSISRPCGRVAPRRAGLCLVTALLAACAGAPPAPGGDSGAPAAPPPTVDPTAAAAGAAGAATAVPAATAEAPGGWPSNPALRERFVRMSSAAEERGLADPYRGVVFGGEMMRGLFPLRSTGVFTEPVHAAAEAFLAGLTPEQRSRTRFGMDDPEWRKWMNQHFYLRQGVGFGEMTPAQRDAAFALLRESLSARGLRTSRDIMRLNHTLGEINDDFEQYGEDLYWVTLMGDPSPTEPWGWQLDGHHLIVNYFVLGDQVVMTPTFMGSEPVTATAGRYAGTSVLQEEQDLGLAMLGSLTEAQRGKAVVQVSRDGNENVGEAFRDNLDLDYVGIRASELSAAQKEQLLGLVSTYVGHLREGHARVRMEEVRAHIDDTWFAWIGDGGPESVFYYRIQSPVILIEFDHQTPVGLRDVPRGQATRQHIHTVVRTPNGNDYGKDLLRQHYEQHQHPH
jgi:hypothetical protein